MTDDHDPVDQAPAAVSPRPPRRAPRKPVPKSTHVTRAASRRPIDWYGGRAGLIACGFALLFLVAMVGSSIHAAVHPDPIPVPVRSGPYPGVVPFFPPKPVVTPPAPGSVR